VPVHPGKDEVAGDRCYPDLASVPGRLQGVIVMVRAEQAMEVVDECIALGIPRIWLFKGLGGAGAVSEEVIEKAEANGIEVVAGACPLMFLEPVGMVHRVHRWFHKFGSRAATG
jgi:predicted CoA-binding protein